MLAYALRRIVSVLPILLGVTLVLFILLYVLPGDPARILTGYRTPSAQSLTNLQDRLDVRAPLYRQYLDYLVDLSQGELGTSFRTQRPVLSIIKETLPNSLGLAFLALLLELLIGIPMGVLAAVKKGTFFDRFSMVVAAVLVAMPVFVLGLAAQLIFGVRLKLLPVSGIGDGGLRFYILPAFVLALIAAAYLTRVTRSSVLDVLSKDYITTARANGLPPWRVLFIHALKNALPAVITVAGLHLGFLIGSAVATEVVFNWPGLGHRLFTAVLQRDRPLVIGATLFLAVIFVLVNLVVDIANAWINPKMRVEGGRNT